jgi:hypothetical protein
MTKLQRLKFELIKYNRTKSIRRAADICNWLTKELLKPEKKIPVTYAESVSDIEVREG